MRPHGGRAGWLRRLMALAVAAAFFLGLFYWKCSASQKAFHPVRADIPAEVRRVEDSIPHYRRDEVSTYLTYPEWYLVFSPQEYAAFIAAHPPSRFPYFAAVEQFWSGYCEVCGIQKRDYDFNAGNHLMLMVIGTSFTAEFVIKGLWERTLGRVSEWTAGGRFTEEDRYAAQVAKEYGEFIPHDPWFEFPFGGKLPGVWTKTGFFGHGFLRKCERKIFLTLEYGIKAIYAGVIRLASRQVFGVAATEVFAAVETPPDSLFADGRLRKVAPAGPRALIVALPHYQGFTDAVPSLTAKGLRFVDIAGSDEILVTAIAPRARAPVLSAGAALFSMPVLTQPDSQRVAVQAPAAALGAILDTLRAQGARVEHLFDY